MLINFFKKLFGKRQTNFYDAFLSGEQAVVNQLPMITRYLADDITLEIYVGDSAAGKDTWAIAVICVSINNKTWRTKYDSGRLNNDLDEMAQECYTNITKGWDLDFFRKQAQKGIK